MSLQELAALLAHSSAMAFTPRLTTTRSSVLATHGGLRRAMPFVATVPFGWTLLPTCSRELAVVATPLRMLRA